MEQLTLFTDSNLIRDYFELILNLKNNGIEFPVNIDEVWPLIYERRDNATKALKENFIESIDYELRQNAKVIKINDIVNGIKVDCYLSVNCLEYFIVRKVRSVFDVYHSVFHKVIDQIQLPDFTNPVIAARAWADEVEKKQLAESKVKELAPKAEIYDKISDCTNLKTVSEVAKVIGTGEIRLFKFMRENHIIMPSPSTIPYQKFITAGYFQVKTKPLPELNRNYTQSYFTSNGELWICDIWNKCHSNNLQLN